MESKNPGENEQIGICPRLFSFFVTGVAFHRWKRFVYKRPIQGEDVVAAAHVDDTLVGNLGEVRDANKEGPVSDILPEKNINQGKKELVARSKTEEEIKEQTEDEKEKGTKKEKEKEKDVPVQNNNNDKEGISGSVQVPIKDAIEEKETVVSTVGSTGAAGARRRTRSRTKKSVSFKDEKADANEAQKRKEKEEGVQQKQNMDMNTKFQKFIDDKKRAMRQGSGVGRKPSS